MVIARERCYFDITIKGRKEGRITFELVSPHQFFPVYIDMDNATDAYNLSSFPINSAQTLMFVQYNDGKKLRNRRSNPCLDISWCSRPKDSQELSCFVHRNRG